MNSASGGIALRRCGVSVYLKGGLRKYFSRARTASYSVFAFEARERFQACAEACMNSGARGVTSRGSGAGQVGISTLSITTPRRIWAGKSAPALFNWVGVVDGL